MHLSARLMDHGTSIDLRPPMSSSKKPPRVTIFTTDSCAHCHRAKAFLRSRHVRFRERNLTSSRSAMTEFQRLGARCVPVIVIGERRIDGFHPDRLERALRHAHLTD